MNKCPTINSVVFVLFFSLLANGFAWAFHGEVFMHELGHHQHTFSLTQTAQAQHQHNQFTDEKDLNLAAHICLSKAYQPHFCTELPLIPTVAGEVIQIRFISLKNPKSVPDLPFHPPRRISHI